LSADGDVIETQPRVICLYDTHANMHTTRLFLQRFLANRSIMFEQFASTISQGGEIKQEHCHCTCAKRAANLLWSHHRQTSHFELHLYERSAI